MKRPDSNTLEALQEIVTHGADEQYIKAACSAAIPQLRDAERWRKLCELIDLGRRGTKRRWWEVRQDNGGFTMKSVKSSDMIELIDAEILKGKQNG